MILYKIFSIDKFKFLDYKIKYEIKRIDKMS